MHSRPFRPAITLPALGLASALWVNTALALEAGASTPRPTEIGCSSTSNTPSATQALPSNESGAPEQRRWYGWQTLIADAAATTLAIAGVATQDPRMTGAGLTVGLSGYALGGPIVHAAHGNWGRAAASLGLRVGVPFAFGSVGYAMADCPNGQFLCGYEGLGIGILLGVATASALDASVLARVSAPSKPSIAPAVQVGRDRTWLGVGGSF